MAAPLSSAPRAGARRHAYSEIVVAAAEYGWTPIAHKIHKNVWARGEQRLIVGFSPTGRAVDTGIFAPLGMGTGYIDDPTPVLTGRSGTDQLDEILSWLASPPRWEPLPSTLLLIPCGARKQPTGAPAAELYTSDHFRLALRAAHARAVDVDARVMILSAKYGLVGLRRVLAPYDVTFDKDDEAVEAEFVARQLAVQHVTTVEALLPSRYLTVLRQAAQILQQRGIDIDIVDWYAGTAGIGYQRSVLSSLLTTNAA